ncbi:hypothetical protein PPROV_000273800 [Pycnococcus provasolii]|uniref:PUB domain-containing protein n=1 Tax=Pycnococcus provasolii TaxID=41880 RepID=A0A830HA70_9CHLO|nr:hypothetical protein PPROV_000273800 [Pycnococcus provasolii]|mmetsp:Transcript_4098/g.9148  ORF Transcript_4098/g.9148 Transcript_4098/m.9148 type:complete len:201 (-) Transcript_4098:309-911(-)
MVYAGYAPGTSSGAYAEISDLSKALRSTGGSPGMISNVASLETMLKICSNVAKAPLELKFRRIRLTNPKVAALLDGAPTQILTTFLGWTVEAGTGEETNETFLTLPADKQINQGNVREIFDAVEFRKKKAADDARAAAARKKPMDPEKAKMMAQLEADRKERSSTREAVTEDSKNQWHKGGNGAQITRAADVGIGCSKGG